MMETATPSTNTPLQHIDALNHRLLQDVADTLAGSHKILMVTGAGISTSLGIPDFRSKDGLYSLIHKCRASNTPSDDESPVSPKKRKFSDIDSNSMTSSQDSASSKSSRASTVGATVKGKDLFDARVWKNPESTSTFYTFIASLRKQIHQEVKQTSQTHKFIRVLRDGGRLMRCYTQNIDGLESREGLSSDLSRGKGSKRRFMKKVFESPRPFHIDKDSDYDGGCEVVPLHGDLDKLRCNLCQKLADWTDADTDLFFEGEAPPCQACSSKAQNRRNSGKRGLSVGLLRPNIVLYQEQHPSEQLLAPLPSFDMAHGPNVLIIMGTSLKVHGLQNLVREFAKAVHTQKDGRVIFVNRTKPSESIWNDFIDDWIEMDCDDWISDLRLRREDLWLRQGELDLKATKAGINKARKKNSMLNPSTSTTGLQQAVSVVIEARKPTTDVPAPEKKRRRKSKTPISPNPAGNLLTPPPSNEKKKRKRKPKDPQVVIHNHTPWTPDTSLTSSNLRAKAQVADKSEPPSYSPVKFLPPIIPETRWQALRSPSTSTGFSRTSATSFTVFNDNPTPSKYQSIQSRTPDTPYAVLTETSPNIRSPNRQYQTPKLVNESIFKGRIGLSVNDLLN